MGVLLSCQSDLGDLTQRCCWLPSLPPGSVFQWKKLNDMLLFCRQTACFPLSWLHMLAGQTRKSHCGFANV